MTTATERTYTTDQDAYETFVGQITPQEFVAPYQAEAEPIDEAVRDFIRQWPYDEAIPSWLEDALYRYVEAHI